MSEAHGRILAHTRFDDMCVDLDYCGNTFVVMDFDSM